MTRVTVHLAMIDGTEKVIEVDVTDVSGLRALKLACDGSPVLVVPFSFHDDSRRLHTICSRVGPGIDEVDW
jgi:hypothetical protein